MVIDVKRMLAGGLAAGVLINLSALAMVPAVGEQMEAALRERGIAPLGPAAAAWVVVLSLILGVILVWLYAAIEPRLGPGTQTAAVAALLVWFLAYCAPNVSNVVFGFMPLGLTVVGTVWGLVELLLAGAVGACIYRGRQARTRALAGRGTVRTIVRERHGRPQALQPPEVELGGGHRT
ncbi:MAG: DUF1761 domain-containing protein [Deltaproteobacteria bacterium]|nr:DUF1761 domain-containing protein [Deltaproteobacteria bacterium]